MFPQLSMQMENYLTQYSNTKDFAWTADGPTKLMLNILRKKKSFSWKHIIQSADITLKPLDAFYHSAIRFIT